MTNRVGFTVAGDPVPLARYRHRRGGGKPYLPARSGEYRKRVQAAWQAAGRPQLGDAPLAMTLVFNFARPASHRKKNGGLRQGAPTYPPRADVSNLVKGVEDALQGLMFVDDAQIVGVVASKRYADYDPCCEVFVTVYEKAVPNPQGS